MRKKAELGRKLGAFSIGVKEAWSGLASLRAIICKRNIHKTSLIILGSFCILYIDMVWVLKSIIPLFWVVVFVGFMYAILSDFWGFSQEAQTKAKKLGDW